MNNTITSFSLHNKFRTIPILTTVQNQSSDNDYKYNYSNHLNHIESIKIKSSLYSNSYLHTDNVYEKKHKKQLQLNQKVVPSIKRLNENLKKKINNNNKKIFNNNINIIKFNKDICSKTTNNYFIGKKIILSKYPLINLNKIAEKGKNMKNSLYSDSKENKTIEINSTFFEKNNPFRNINNAKGVTKIEKEINDLLNKTKINKLEYNSDNHKSNLNNKSQNSLFNHENDSKIKMNNEKFFLKESKIANENKENILNKKRNRNDLFNQYLNSNIVKRKVLFIDKYNNTVTNDNTITLLNGERDYLLEKYITYKDDKGNNINLPLLQENNKNKDQNSKFITQYNKKLGKEGNETKEQAQSGSLSQLIKDRFTKQNYNKQKITGTQNDYAYYNPTMINNEGGKDGLLNLTMNIFKNQNLSTNKKRNRRKGNKPNPLNDILGVIKAKTIGPKTKKKKKQKSSKKEIEKEKEKGKTKNNNLKKKRLNGNLSQANVFSSFWSHKNLVNREKDLKSMIGVPITINGIRGKKVRVTLVKKKNKMVPINEEGEEVNDPKMLSDFYEKIKIKINSEKIKNLLPKKRLTVNIVEAFVNPIHINSDEEEDKSSDSSKSYNWNKDLENQYDNFFDSIKDKEESDKNETYKKELNSKSSLKKGKNITKEINKNESTSKKEEENNKKKKSVKIIEKSDKKKDPNEFVYKDEDDFVKDFNFDFSSSEDDSISISKQKLIRKTRKKINKNLFEIFKFIANNADMDTFKKDDLIKYLIDKEFRNTFRQLKEHTVKLRELEKEELDPEGKDKKKKIYIRDIEMINYIYRYIQDTNSLFYKTIYKRIKKEKEEYENLDKSNNYSKLFKSLKESEKGGKKRREFSIYSKRDREYSEDKYHHSRPYSKKFAKKKRAQKDLEFISQDEKKLLILGEINLTNEIRYQISIANDKESREKFKNLLNKIESLRRLSGDEYVKSLKQNFSMFKDEAAEILKAKEIEERLNGFLNDFNNQRNNLKDKHRYIMSSMYIKDYKFLSYFEKKANE